MVVPIEATTTPETTKPKSKFGFKFLRFFGSTRSKKGTNINSQHDRSRAKSVDRKLEKVQTNIIQSEVIKSSSSSPMVGTRNLQKTQSNPTNFEDPAMLSISTEWEFEPQEDDEQNGNKTSTSTLFENILIQKKSIPTSSNKSSKDRKSSGYDSLGGDESSSLDSSEHPVLTAAKVTPSGQGFETPSMTNKPIRLSREMNNSLAMKAFFAASKRQPMIHPEIQPQYSMPNDYYGQIANHNLSGTPGKRNSRDNLSGTPGNRSSTTGLNIMQYDEVDIRRMEQRQKKPGF